MTDDGKNPGAGNARQASSVAYLDHALWSRLLEGGHTDAALQSWLALQCDQIEGVERGVVVARRSGPFRPIAFWPNQGKTSKFLMETVNSALKQQADSIRESSDHDGIFGVARLVRIDARITAVVGLEVRAENEAKRQAILRQLQWGTAWLELFERRRSNEDDESSIERLRLALDALATAGEQSRFRAAAAAALTSLAIQMNAARVSFGIRNARGCRVAAISNTTQFDKRVKRVRAIAQAMDEAADQAVAITVSNEQPESEPPAIRRKAEALRDSRGSSLVAVQPFIRNGKVAGAMVFEWARNEFPPAHVQDAIVDIVALLAPILYDKKHEERWLITRAFGSLRTQLVRLLGPGYFGRKMAALVLASLIIFFAVYKTEFRVTADARLRGAIERVVAAPLDGYIVEAEPRAGDTIEQGRLLVQLDDVEYQLERFSWVARKHQFEAEYAQALAEFDRAGINILRARVEEAEAQIHLNDTRIDLARITAPFDAVVVSGDLSQSLGQSVQRGEELFRIAPLDSFVVEVQVPETDILYVNEGAKASLVLSSLPQSEFQATVRTVTPVTAATDGGNHFLVEAELSVVDGAPVSPGMEGVLKINAGEQRLIWIWTRRATDWLRLTLWRWLP